MSHPILKITTNNIINLWFGEDTPIRQNKILMNSELWDACERVGKVFNPPSGALSIDKYRKSDFVAFAKVVQEELNAKAFFGELTQ